MNVGQADTFIFTVVLKHGKVSYMASKTNVWYSKRKELKIIFSTFIKRAWLETSTRKSRYKLQLS